MKVIKDNMIEKRKRMAELEQQKKNDADQVAKNMKMTLEKEQAREAEMVERGRRIQAVMDSMGDVVRDNSKQEQLDAEKAYIAQCLEKDEQARLQDINKKNRLRAEHQKLNEALGSQVREKRLREENEARANKSYMNRWVERAEEDNR